MKFYFKSYTTDAFNYLYVKETAIALFAFDKDVSELSPNVESLEQMHERMASVSLPSEIFAEDDRIIVSGALIGKPSEERWVCRTASSFALDGTVGAGEKTGHDRWVFLRSRASGNLLPPVNQMVEYSLGKTNTANRAWRVGDTTIYGHLFAPVATQDLFADTNSFLLFASRSGEFGCNLGRESFEELPEHFDPYPEVRITGPDSIPAGETEEYVVALVKDEERYPFDATLYVSSSAGYIPVRTVHVKNGVGAFRATALGLRAVEKMVVKVSWKYFTGAAEKEIAIV